MGFAESPKSSIVVGGQIKYYTAYSSTNAYVEKVFGGNCNSITIQNTHASDPVQFSFDGTILHGELSGGESIRISVGSSSSVYLKSTGGTAVVRLWGW